MALAVCGPVLVEIPPIILCDDEIDRLEADPSIECGTWKHQVARVVAWVSMFALVFGLPAVMFWAASTSGKQQHDDGILVGVLPKIPATIVRTGIGNATVADKKKHNQELKRHAEKLARAKFVRSWREMDPASQKHEIEKCLTDLHNQEMASPSTFGCRLPNAQRLFGPQGSEIWFLSNLQMSVRPGHSVWYPVWFVMRRTLINLFFIATKFGYVSNR